MRENFGRDWWEKIEILAKVFGSVFVPLAVAAFFWSWNSERNQAAEEAERLKLAISILSGPVSQLSEDDELFQWAQETIARLFDRNIVPSISTGETTLSIVCDAIQAPLVELANAVIDEGPSPTMSATRNVVATMDSVCSFRFSQR